MKQIKLELKVEIVNRLCAICESSDFDVNVICGRVCVDGRSIIGVMKMCGRIVTLSPITQDQYDIETFYRRVKEIGAFYSEDY